MEIKSGGTNIMPAGFRQVFITFSIIMLFVFSTISFVVIFQSENDSNNTILENELINRTFIKAGGNISSQQTSTSSSQESFEAEVPEKGLGSLIIFAIVGVVKGFTKTITQAYNLVIVLPISALGVPNAVAQILGSILMVSLVLLAWRVYRVGS